MSISSVVNVRPQIETKGLVGAGVGTAVGAGVALAGMKAASFPLPVALVAGAAIGGPIAAVSLLNNSGEPSKGWQSIAIGAAPLAVIGGALGAFAQSWDGGSGTGKLAILGAAFVGAATFGVVGGAVGGAAHWATKPD